MNEVYPNRISTSQIRLGLSIWAGRRGPGCASDRHIGGGCPGFSAWYPAPRVYDIYIQLCPGDTVEARPPSVLLSRHALVPGIFLWSSSVRRSRVRPGHLQRPPTLFFILNIGQRKRLTHSVTFAVALTEPTWIWTTIQIKSDRNRISFSCHMRLDLTFSPFIFPVQSLFSKVRVKANSQNCGSSLRTLTEHYFTPTDQLVRNEEMSSE